MEIDDLTEQKVIISFLEKLWKTSNETHGASSTVSGGDALMKTALFKWIKRFREIREDCKDNARPGRPLTTFDDQNIERVQPLTH